MFLCTFSQTSCRASVLFMFSSVFWHSPQTDDVIVSSNFSVFCSSHDKDMTNVPNRYIFVYWFMIDGSDRSDCQRDWWSSWATCSSSQHSTWIKGKISKTEIFQFVKLYFYEVDFCIEAFLWIWLNVKSSIFDDIIFLLWVWPIRAQYLYWFKIKCVYENWSVFFWLTPHFVFKSLLTKTNDRCAGE